MIARFLFLLLPADTVPPVPHDSLHTDTLKEVVVDGKRDRRLPVMDAIDESVGKYCPRTLPLGEILEKVAPGLQDKMLHPFAVKQRKRERHKKKMRKVLEHYNKVKSFHDLLEEAVRRQEMEDERQARKDETGSTESK